MSTFHRLVSPIEPERVVEQVLKTWIDFYLAEVERQSEWPGGPGSIARPRAWLRRNLIEAIPGEEDSPAIIVLSRGATEPPRRSGTGKMSFRLDIGVACITSTYDANLTREHAGMYAIALAAIMMQRKHLDNLLEGCKVISMDDLRLDDLGAEDQRSRAMVRLQFTVECENMLTAGIGPGLLTPPVNPYDPAPDWHTAETVEVVVDKTE